ncbi:helix-turn-helix transcriptional regulator [Trinickia dinghuensis]|uniref:AraC family transcriptional regulator n=1 Tax=Trinickia dinghuensis TaxID=2291023 RepID=A0A3D8JUH2_9BURK|nr:helix-turn-helix transcriptional regulator [Trinickia dinghuensis]RDU96739.1 AraC family transcriptional regulator [Trinickia dinghuensis]
MPTSLYFAVAAALSSTEPASSFCAKMLAGEFHEASAIAAARVEPEQPASASAPCYEHWQAYADVQLVLGRYEEAEDGYRHAQRAVRGQRGETRAVLSRNAGWQALFRDHLDTALRSFRRAIDDESARVELKLECLVGAALALFHLGRLDGARARLDALAALAGNAHERRWSRLADALRQEFLAQYALRASDALDDHIYWRSAILEFRPAEASTDAAALAESDAPQIGVLTRRIDFFQHLQALARGSHSAIVQLERHMRWSVEAKIDEYHRSLRLEVALAALAANMPSVAESMLYLFRDTPAHAHQHARWYLEYLYCQSKVRERQGRLQDHAQLYRRYALLSLKHVRADSATAAGEAAERAQPVADDISARLPGRYRRAYRYLVDHLGESSLSVSEVAAHIGVTERALQAAFKSYLGVSPSELIRQKRLEHIRNDLLDEDMPNGSVLRIANRWGLQHRSTLLNGYRKRYNEPPSMTAAR